MEKYPTYDWDYCRLSYVVCSWPFVKKYKDKPWDWQFLFNNPDFLCDFTNDPEPDISENISVEIIESHPEKNWNYKFLSKVLDWSELITSPTLLWNEDGTPKLVWDWDEIKKSFKWELYKGERPKMFSDYKFKFKLFYYSKFAWEYIKENPNEMWSYDYLSSNTFITWDFIKEHKDKSWNWSELSKNPQIKWQIVQENPNEEWDWNALSSNPNITRKIVNENLDKPWNWKILHKRKIYIQEMNNNVQHPYSSCSIS